MRARHLGSDLGLIGDGLRIAREFGFQPLEEMAAIAVYLERSVYRKGSMRAVPGGVAFELSNPPLRMGAFESLALHWDGSVVAPERCTAKAGESGPAIPFLAIRRASPLVLRPGVPTEFRAALGPVTPGVHTARVELRSVAIPPTVWIEVTDHLRSAVAADP
ncbi:MAG TPA: hypothetical protein VJQ43_03430 [Thermoplasmata archaeon]|nr:hypothetical protein [Thermoplasmata archaeon]